MFAFFFILSVPAEVLGQVGEEYLLYAACGTALGTRSAACALFVVNNGAVVYDLDSVTGTELFALTTSDTSVLAGFTSICAFVMAAAVDDCCCLLRNHGNDMLGAGLYAHSTADTASRVDVCDAVGNADRVRNADGSAVTATQTAVSAELGPAVGLICRLAGCDSLIVCLCRRGLAGAVAVNERHEILRFFNLYAHDLTKLFCNGLGTRNTKIGFRLTLCHSLGIVVTALESAGTAVDARENLSYFLCRFILLDSEEVSDKCKQDAEKQTYRHNNGKRS